MFASTHDGYRTRLAKRMLTLAAALAAAGIAASASASTFTWTGGTGTSQLWNFGANWGGTAPASGSDPDLVFTGTNNITNLSQNIATPFVVNSITFSGATTGSFTLVGSQIEFDGGTGIAQSTNVSQSIANAILLAAKEDLAIGGTGTGVVTLSGNITQASGSGSNAATIVKSGTSVYVLSGTNNYSGGTTISGGILVAGSASALGSGSIADSATFAVGSGVTFTKAVTFNSGATLAGLGTYTPGSTVAITRTVAPGIDDGTNSIGTLSIGNNTTFSSASTFAVDVGAGANNADKLAITGTAGITAGATLTINNTGADQGLYTLLTSTGALSGTFTGTAPTGYKLVYSANQLQLQHFADQSLTTTMGSVDIISGSSLPITATLTNTAPSGSAGLAVALANNTGSLTVTSISPGSGTVAVGTPVSVTGTITTVGTAGTGKTWKLKNTDASAITSPATLTGTVNVFDHSAPALTVTAGNSQTVIVGATGITATLNLADGTPGQANLAQLDVNTLSSGLTGSTGTNIVASGSSANYTAALSTSTLGTNSQTFSLNTGDRQTITNASALTSKSAGVTLNVLDHSAPALTVSAGNSQTVIVGAAGITATLNLADGTPGQTNLSPLDVNTLSSGLTGSTGTNIVASGSSANYTAALSTSTLGTNSQTFSLMTGDQQSVAGHSALTSKSAGVTLNVLDHSAPALTVSAGNSQTVIVGAAGITATLNLADGTPGQTNLASLDVNTLSSGLTGSTGTNIVASGSSANYTAALSTSTLGTNSQTFSLMTGDQQSITGHSALANKSTNVTLTVMDHAAASFNSGTTQTPTLTVDISGTQGSGTVDSSAFSIFNLAGGRVNLKLTGMDVAGDPVSPTAISLDSLAISGLTQGTSTAGILAHLDTSAVGSFQNIYTLHFADDSGLAGAAPGTDLVLTVNGSVTPLPTPEPASVGILGLGCAGLLLRRRRALV